MPGTEAYLPLVLDGSQATEDGAHGGTGNDADVEEHGSAGYKDEKMDGIFRDRPWSEGDGNDDAGEGGDAEEQAHVGLHQIHSKSSGSAGSKSFLGGESDWDDDDDDDEAEIARYHMNVRARNDVPLPAEFMKESFLEFLWHAFINLQTNARHRRAARLLNMPSQSKRHRIQAAFVTWCCDGTDLAILLVLGWVFAWIFWGCRWTRTRVVAYRLPFVSRSYFESPLDRVFTKPA